MATALHPPRRSYALPALYALFCLVSLLPFLLVKQPPILDYANHAARLSLACAPHDPAVAAMYRYRLGIIPDLAVDLVNLPLCGVLAPDQVLKLVIAVSLGLIYLAGWAIQRRLYGGANAFLLLLPALAFNDVTAMGYINFLAGIALGFAAIAAILWAGERRGAVVAIGNSAGIAIFFCHIFALAFAMAAVWGLMLQRASRSPRGILAATGWTLASFALPLLLVPLVPGDGEPLLYSYQEKLRGLVGPFFTLDDRSIAVVPIVAGLVLMLLVTRCARIDTVLRWPLAVTALYALALPGSIKAAYDVDARTMVAVAYLFAIALRPVGSTSLAPLLSGAIAAWLTGLNLWAVQTVWLPFDRQMSEFRQATALLPPQAKVLSVMQGQDGDPPGKPAYYWHVTSYATLDRRIFNPLDFTGVGMQPLSPTPAFAPYDTPSATPPGPQGAMDLADPTPEDIRDAHAMRSGYALHWPRRFDYVIYYHFEAPPNFDPDDLELVRNGSFFSILKTRRAV